MMPSGSKESIMTDEYPSPDKEPPKAGPTVGEARALYDAIPLEVPEMVTTRLSGKNQLTLPVAMTRYLGLRAGDEVDIMIEGKELWLRRHLSGRALLDSLQGAAADIPEWSTAEKIEAWIREGRDWEPTHGID
jgi:bifunctional DNA-binding transcriptional regulator/antitoxin component of YhaV-PrlF toxin-antitoxin module